MSNFLKNPIRLIRYLVVWKVNSSLVVLPNYLSAELSLNLATVITNRSPTKKSGPWRKFLALWDGYTQWLEKHGKPHSSMIPDACWPIQTILVPYPCKRFLGVGEVVVWELKLLGTDADHGVFLETILPAMEELSYTSSLPIHRTNSLWGNFDVYAVYVARGPHWEPLVEEGKLNLRYHVDPYQWGEESKSRSAANTSFRTITWTTPFTLENIFDPRHEEESPFSKTPHLQTIIGALICRLDQLAEKKDRSLRESLDQLSLDELSSIEAVMNEARNVSILFKDLSSGTDTYPAGSMGSMTFAPIPSSIVPYLELASIVHIGHRTHFGCGTFILG